MAGVQGAAGCRAVARSLQHCASALDCCWLELALLWQGAAVAGSWCCCGGEAGTCALGSLVRLGDIAGTGRREA